MGGGKGRTGPHHPPLYEERIVTAKTYAEAEQAYKQAKAAYSASAASGQAVSPIDGVITRMLVQEGEYVEAGTPIAVACSEEMLTLRADLPERFRSRLPQISSANVADPITGQVYSLDEMGAKRITSPKGIASQRGYVPLYFTFDNNGQLTHGSYLKVYLLGEPVAGAMSVPLSALSEQQGAYFVYRQIDDDCYEKLPVKIGANDGTNVEILSGLNGDEQIVVDGVVAVRLAESSRVAPEGHSHNH
ncbi:MAG: efflux RND transporter periplasmic adaptor subunit [Bacteroidales bacterium]|nr:efflux RND transporter periplasmic adaptor subunit [Bacteroidales bacterium]